MDRFEQAAILTELIDGMRASGSWAGETHIQKGTYFLQQLLEVPLGFRFILYKHGPFSFDLRDALAIMRADHFIDVDVQPYPYGPRVIPTDSSRAFGSQYGDLLDRYRPRINFVAQQLRNHRVADLEQYATALYVSHGKQKSERERADEINKLKPHVSVSEAIQAIKFVDDLSIAAESLLSNAA